MMMMMVVIKLWSWFQPLSNQSAKQGDRVVLECAIPTYPAPEKVQWFRNEVEIFTSPDYTISFSVGVCTLVIAEVFPEDSGTYRCMVTVNGVPNSSSMHLHVAGQYQRLFTSGCLKLPGGVREEVEKGAKWA